MSAYAPTTTGGTGERVLVCLGDRVLLGLGGGVRVLATRAAAMSDEIQLSERQLEVTLRVAGDASAKEISRELGISIKTVEKHMAEAARRILLAEPDLKLGGSPRRIIRAYYVHLYGTMEFERRLRRKAA